MNRLRLPLNENRKSRFCPFCGLVVHEFYKLKLCPHKNCKRLYSHIERPELPKGAEYCKQCIDGIIQKNYLWCSLCHGITNMGRQWQKFVADKEKAKAELDKKANEYLNQLLTGTEDDLLNDKNEANTEDSAISPPEKKPRNKPAGQINDFNDLSSEADDEFLLTQSQQMEHEQNSDLQDSSKGNHDCNKE